MGILLRVPVGSVVLTNPPVLAAKTKPFPVPAKPGLENAPASRPPPVNLASPFTYSLYVELATVMSSFITSLGEAAAKTPLPEAFNETAPPG